jgi:transcriptional regulator of arginine metabolism
MSTTDRRREAILHLVASRALATQEELVKALAEVGFNASQASVSRDVAALGLVKRGGLWATPLRDSNVADPREERISSYLLSVAPAGDHLLVLKTPPGEAPGVALALDHLNLDDVVGTVAGDDTIFVATVDGAAGRRLTRRLNDLLEGARSRTP